MLAEVLKVRADGLWCTTSAKLCVGAGSCRSAAFEVVSDETVHVGFLDPFVDDGTRPGVDHLVAEDGCLVVECASSADVATGFGEEDWDVILRGVLLQEDVAGGFESGVSAPAKSQ